MANGYNPYTIASGLIDSTETSLQAEQARKMQEFELAQQKGELSEEFQREAIASQKEQERLLNRKRKKGLFEQIAPILSMFNPIAGGVIGGLTGMGSMRSDQKKMERNIEAAKGVGLGGKWGGTFLGGQARDIGAQQDTMLTGLEEQSKRSGMDFLKSGLIGGISGYSMGKMGAGIGEGFSAAAAAKELPDKAVKALGETTLADIGAAEAFIESQGLTDITADQLLQIQQYGMVGAEGLAKSPYLKALFGEKGFGQKSTTILDEDEEFPNILTNLSIGLLGQKTGGE